VLVFDRNASWYFGREPRVLPEHLIHLAPGPRDRDFLVNGVQDADSHALENWLRSIARPGIHAPPRDAAPKRQCGC
jgi:hypothetical protein